MKNRTTQTRQINNVIDISKAKAKQPKAEPTTAKDLNTLENIYQQIQQISCESARKAATVGCRAAQTIIAGEELGNH